MLQQKYGVLSTLSVEVPGYPFGSVTPYCLDRQGFPIILISDIAQHTKNIQANPNVSLTILDHNLEDVQANSRLTVLANAVKMENTDVDTQNRYYSYFSQSKDYHKTHDFSFYRLQLVRVRFIGGFGQIYWLDKDHFALGNPFTETEELRVLIHMNEDHQSAIKHYFKADEGITIGDDQSVSMVGIDAEGFDILLNRKHYRFTFEKPIRDMNEAREALISMARI